MRKSRYILIAVIVVAISSGFAIWKNNLTQRLAVLIHEPDSLYVDGVTEPEFIFGLRADSAIVIQEKIRPNQSISDILLPLGVSHKMIFDLAANSKDDFDLRKIKSGKPYKVLMNLDSTVAKLVYEPNQVDYVVLHLDDSLYSETIKREVTTVRKVLSGTVEYSVAVTIDEKGGPVALTNRFVDVFAWQIDFFRLQKGDYFKIIYLEEQVEGESIGIENIEAIYFNHYGNDYWGFAYDQGEGIDFFDEKGNSLRKALLKYPLEFSRISSRFTLNRFHPVQKRWKAHKGTDFAAITGTPIRSVGDGIITEAMFRQLNGNYVKIRHNSTYTTQYLHMSKIAPGIKPGVKVSQGQLIGFVGSTGLTTGPHLCYRFWKNGVQVDALKVELPPSNPITEDHVDRFTSVKNGFIDMLGEVGRADL